MNYLNLGKGFLQESPEVNLNVLLQYLYLGRMKFAYPYFFVKTILLIGIGLLLWSSCQKEKRNKKFKIGFSQCCIASWRTVMENEMHRAMAFYPEAELEVKVADDNSERQIQQIEAFLSEDIDALIVAPYETKPLTQIIEKVYQQGIPVVLIDRETESENYTAYIGADNYEIGKTACQYIANQFKEGGKIIEIQMSKSISPTLDRSNGFRDALKDYPHLEIVAAIEESITMEKVDAPLLEALEKHPEANIIYAHNDKLARNAYQVIRDHPQFKDFFFVGVDGLIGKNEGIEMVENGILDASLLYPTGGNEAIISAMSILNGFPVEKRKALQTTVIDEYNAQIIKHQLEKVQNLQNDISQQIKLKEELKSTNKNQQFLIFILIGSLTLTLLLGGFLWRALYTKQKMNRNLRHKNQEISRQKEQLEEMSVAVKEANQAKVDFFTNVSHEFKTPLTLILGFAEDLPLSTKLSKDTQQGILMIKQNAKRLLRLVKQLMDFRKLERTGMKLKARETDLGTFVLDILQSYQLAAKKKGIDLVFNPPPQKIKVWFDANMMDKVIFNILSNAFKFTKEKGKITVFIGLDDSEDQCYIKIEDEGIGMDEQTLQHIFDPFFQGEEKEYEGTGLGLPLSKKLMELHHGNILVESQKGKGSRFTIIFPLGKAHFREDQLADDFSETSKRTSHDLLPSAIVLETAENPSTENLPFILIIEDNPDIQFFLQQKFQSDYQLITATDGKQGKEMAYEHIPDLIICDVKMPKEDGLSVTKELKNDLRTSHIPILLLTAGSTLDHQIEGTKSGADAYITKPFNVQFLREKIKNLLLNRQILRASFAQGSRPKLKKKKANPIDAVFLQQFIDYMDENFHRQNLQVADLCKELHLSRSQLYRKTKALLGQSIGDYIQSVRLQKAEELLKEGKLSIAEIAYQVGYTSPEYFSTVFKKKYEVIPSKYAEG